MRIFTVFFLKLCLYQLVSSEEHCFLFPPVCARDPSGFSSGGSEGRQKLSSIDFARDRPGYSVSYLDSGIRGNIMLLKTQNDIYHSRINSHFKTQLPDMIFFNVSKQVRPGDLASTLNDIKDIDGPSIVIIHLYVKDTRRNCNVVSGPKYNVSSIQPKTCKGLNNKVIDQHKFLDAGEIEPDGYSYDQHFTKIASQSILNYPHLHDIVVDFLKEDKNDNISFICNPLTVIACTIKYDVYTSIYHPKQLNRRLLNIVYKTEEECEANYFFKKTHHPSVILTPRPLNIPENINALTIFYENFDLLPEHRDIYKNPLPLLESLDYLKFAFLKMMKETNINRVAIVSDFSPISQKFEKEITALFRRDKITYASRSCESSACDYEEVMEPILSASPSVIILNIMDESREHFTNYINSKQTTTYITWLIRGWSPSSDRINSGKTYYISLSPPCDREVWMDKCNVMGKTLSRINEIVSRNVLFDFPRYPSHKFDYRKNLTSEISSDLKNRLYGQVLAFVSEASTNIIAKMEINSEDSITWHSYSNLRIYMGIKKCNFVSDSYYRMCDDDDIIYLMMVICMFSIMLLGLVCFFQAYEDDVPYSRMNR